MTKPTNSAESPTTEEFFRYLYQDAPDPTACISLFLVRRSDGKKVSAHVPVSDPARAAKVALEADRAGADVYFGVGLRRPGLGAYERGGDEDVVYVPGMWIDVDYGYAGHASDKLPPDQQTAMRLLDENCSPNVVVDTGGGLHAYLLQRDTTARDVRNFQKYVAKGFAEEGYHVDMLADLARVLRVPGTHNHKVADNIRPVQIIEFKGKAIPMVGGMPAVDFKKEHTPTKPAQKPTEVKGDPKKFEALSAIPAPSVVARHAASVDIRSQLAAITTDDLKPLAQAVLAGRPFAPKGSRDAALYRIAAMVAAIDPYGDVDALVELLKPTINATAERDGDWDVEEIYTVASGKLERALERAQRVKEENEDLREAMYEMAGGKPKEKPAPKATPPVAPDFLRAASGVSNMPPAHQLIITKGDACFVWCPGVGYKAPIRERELVVRLRDDWFKGGNSGKLDVQMGKLDEVKSRYSTVARHLVSDMSLTTSYYDEKEETFFEAVCPRRDLKPEYHAQVDEWLKLLGGDHADKLLDWVATLGRLDQYSSALYLAGATGAGKSLLVKGLARRWKSGPTELKRILENFNEDLAKCPLVFADEEMPSMFRGKPSTAVIRELITQKSRTLSRKFLPPSDLRGALRLVIAANNDSLLSMGNEKLTPADLEAFGQRFLHIRCPEAAAEYLRSIGGQAVVSAWVDDDILAKHSLWLEQNRTVTPGARFYVEGIPSILKRILATRGRITAAVCEWLARHLDKPNPSVEGARYRVRAGSGRLLVHASTIADHWECYIRSPELPRPSVANLSDALKHISLAGTVDIDGLNYYEIDVPMFLDWARDHSVGDLNAMKGRIGEAGAKAA